MRHIFLSPHMDDAVLSAGSLIHTLAQKEQVMVITIFTAFGKRPISWNAQAYILKSRQLFIRSFTRQRKKEDARAMHILSVPYMHLDIVDGGFRKNDKGTLLYPLYLKLFTGHLHPYDQNTEKDIYTKLTQLLAPEDILYAPIGIGNHADHLILNRTVKRFTNTTYFWLDQPYAWKKGIQSPKGYTQAFITKHDPKKITAIRCYTSQVKQLFPGVIPTLDEVFHTASRV